MDGGGYFVGGAYGDGGFVYYYFSVQHVAADVAGGG
jgi:hypothetical protein